MYYNFMYVLGTISGVIGCMQTFTMIGAEFTLSSGFKRYFLSDIEMFLKINARKLYRYIGFTTLWSSLCLFAIGFALEYHLFWLAMIIVAVQCTVAIKARRYIHQEVQHGTRFAKKD